MYIYYFIAFFITILFLFLSKLTNKKLIKRLFIIFSFMSIFLFSALRYNVGGDYQSYVDWFNSINTVKFEYRDFLFNFMIMIIKLFTNDPQYLFVASSFFILFFIYSAFLSDENYDLRISLFLLLGFYFSSNTFLRQWMAASLFLYSFKYLKNRSFIKYFCIIIISSLFHSSALVLLPLYFVFQLKFKIKNHFLLLIVFFIIIFFVDYMSIFAKIVKLFSEFYYLRLISGTYHVRGSIFPVALYLGIFLLYIIFKEKIIKKVGVYDYDFKRNVAFIILIFSFLNFDNSIFNRVAYVYIFPLCIYLIPDFLCIVKVKFEMLFKLFIVLIGAIYISLNVHVKKIPGPYYSVLDKGVDLK